MQVIPPHTRAAGVAIEVAESRIGPEILEYLREEGVGGLPGPQAFASPSLWPTRRREPVAAQFVAREEAGRSVIGYVSLHGHSAQSGYLRCAVAVDGRLAADRQATVTALAVNYAFSVWNIRKVYFWTPETEVVGLAASGVRPVREGVLAEHVLDGDRLRSAYIFAVYRDQWQEQGLAFLNGLLRRPGGEVPTGGRVR